MGIGGIGIWQLLIILVIVLLLFGTKKLKNLGGDLGGAIRGFKKAVSDDKDAANGEGDGADAATAELAADDDEKSASGADARKQDATNAAGGDKPA
ncbi:MAG: twin-arginine translocase TatA/TatE family subunit [bacterium]